MKSETGALADAKLRVAFERFGAKARRQNRHERANLAERLYSRLDGKDIALVMAEDAADIELVNSIVTFGTHANDHGRKAQVKWATETLNALTEDPQAKLIALVRAEVEAAVAAALPKKRNQ